MTQIDRGMALSFPQPESATPLRLVLVENHAVLRDGLKALLELDVPSYEPDECPQCRAGDTASRPGSRFQRAQH